MFLSIIQILSKGVKNVLFPLFLLSVALATQAQTTRRVRVRVVDAEHHQSLPHVRVTYSRRSYLTDSLGTCHVKVSDGKFVVLSVSSMGYHPVVRQRFALIDSVLVVSMRPSTMNLGTVTITAQQRQTQAFQQVEVIDAKALEKGTSLSLAQLLEKAPGVSSISSGNAVGKPVIQGMHSSRILLINNGVRLESQSWGIDHAPEIDHTSAAVVEVIKGAESIRYGYGAMGGVVLFNDAPLPYGHDRLKVGGKVNLGYSTNARAADGAATIELGRGRWGARLHAMGKTAGDYHTADYLLNNTGYRNLAFSSQLGYRSQAITATLAASLFYLRNGIYYGSKVSDIEQLLARFAIGRPEANTIRPFGASIVPPFQHAQHVTFKGDVRWTLSPVHELQLRLSYQVNLREEFENRKTLQFSWLPVQDLRLTTHQAEALWTARWRGGQHTQAGLTTMYQENYNVPGTQQPAFIPNFAALSSGLYVLHRLSLGPLTASAGLRYDIRGLDVDGYTSLSNFKYFSAFKAYHNLTANVAAHYRIGQHWEARANLGWAWRPPEVNELYANGLHHGSYWVQGNPQLKNERGYKVVVGGRFHNDRWSIEPSLFYQRLDNYIYDNIGTGQDRFHIHPSGKYPKFIYGQDNVSLTGGDLVATVQPTSWLSLTAKGEWIWARNLTQNNWLPFMPSDRYTLMGDYHFGWGKARQWTGSLGLEINHVTQQRRFDPVKNLVPEAPPAYTLVGTSAEVGTTLRNGHRIKLMLLGSNVLNALYKEYTDRFRYYAHGRGAQYTLKLVYDF
ncbi:MAG: TonB-dependent receptor [Bacteroidaceae bacterium]|nr:TonB-dependent receptor [Bacteroidaceae bacterium]